MIYDLGPNDGGIKRGDSMETGDEEARPTDGVGPDGSGVRSGDDGPAGMSTGDPSSEAEVLSSYGYSGGGLEDLSIVDADDPSLGLTDIGEIPADDWAADTGPSRNPSELHGLTTKKPGDRGSTLSEKS